MSRNGPIPKALRAQIEELVWIHGKSDCVPVHKENGVFNIDMQMKDANQMWAGSSEQQPGELRHLRSSLGKS
ncbi:MAG: hypothetical protein VX803_08770, partial [Pseudomonadota bacterium]|nr:hypothetical protein [Pseudomonadota bacterium]